MESDRGKQIKEKGNENKRFCSTVNRFDVRGEINGSVVAVI